MAEVISDQAGITFKGSEKDDLNREAFCRMGQKETNPYIDPRNLSVITHWESLKAQKTLKRSGGTTSKRCSSDPENEKKRLSGGGKKNKYEKTTCLALSYDYNKRAWRMFL